MSQKTNPTSLRLQKTSQNFCYPWFADYYWNETFQACFESQNYITAFLKETSFSKAFFSAKVFYRKLPFFLFLQDNRVAKKEKLLLLKKPIAFSSVNDRESPISKKMQISLSLPKAKTAFSINNEKTNTVFCDYNTSLFYSNNYSRSKSTLSCFFKDDFLSKDLRLIKKVVRDDYLKTKQGFFYNLPYTMWDNKVKDNLILLQQHKKALFEKKISNTVFFLPKQSVTRYPKIFVRPCLSFCENIMSSLPLPLPKAMAMAMTKANAKRNMLSPDYTKGLSLKSQNFKQINAKQSRVNQGRENLLIYNTLFKNQKNFVASDILSNNKTSKTLKTLAKEKKPYPINLQPIQNHLSTSEEIRKSIQGLRKIRTQRLTCNNKTKIGFFPRSITFEPIRFLKEHQNVFALADIIISLLEKRISFRQIKSLLFKNLLLDPQIKGIRISCSGRLGGRSKKAQKAKVQSDSCGATTLATFSSNILFASKSAHTSYGKVGVKIWLSFDDKRCTQL